MLWYVPLPWPNSGAAPTYVRESSGKLLKVYLHFVFCGLHEVSSLANPVACGIQHAFVAYAPRVGTACACERCMNEGHRPSESEVDRRTKKVPSLVSSGFPIQGEIIYAPPPPSPPPLPPPPPSLLAIRHF